MYTMSVTFTKLFASITESTVWMQSDHVRLVWITMLAMADRKGRVFASIPGLAHRARVDVDLTKSAIQTFLEPDEYSRSPENEGRRILPIDGGWRLVNHEKYRALRDEEVIKESKRKYINARRAKEKEETPGPRSTVDKVDTMQRAESREQRADAGKKKKEGESSTLATPSPTSRTLPDDAFIQSLKENIAYQGIDIDREIGKMQAWLAVPKNKRRRMTHQFIVNWLNKAERPVQFSEAHGTPVLTKPQQLIQENLDATKRFLKRRGVKHESPDGKG